VYSDLLDPPIQSLRALVAAESPDPCARQLLGRLLTDQAMMLDRHSRQAYTFELLREARELAHATHDTALENRILCHRAQMAFFRGDLDNAEQLAQQVFTRVTRPRQQLWVATMLAAICGMRGELRPSQMYTDHAAALAGQINDRRGAAWVALVRSWMYQDHGNYRQALDLLQIWLPTIRQLGDRRCEWFYLACTGTAMLERYGPHTGGKRALIQARDLAHRLDDRRAMGYTALFQARYALCSGDLAAARDLLEQTCTHWQPLHEQGGYGYALCYQGILAHWQHDNESAVQFGRRALLAARATGWRRAQFDALLLLSRALTALGDTADAAVFAGQALDTAETIRHPAQILAAQAAIADAELTAGRRGAALARAEYAVSTLTPQALAGLDDPVYVYLICAQIFAAADDPRTHELLAGGQALIEARAALLPDRQARIAFYQIPSHRMLLHMLAARPSDDELKAREYGV
jgi:ATP/maltotriose-dependent transcriptional regulator MalT